MRKATVSGLVVLTYDLQSLGQTLGFISSTSPRFVGVRNTLKRTNVAHHHTRQRSMGMALNVYCFIGTLVCADAFGCFCFDDIYLVAGVTSYIL